MFFFVTFPSFFSPFSLFHFFLFPLLQWLAVVGVIFVSVAIFFYISVIVAAIVSTKCINTAQIVRWQKLHAKKAHFWFITTTLFVGIVVLYVGD